MAAPSTHSGEMSQDSMPQDAHRKGVAKGVHAPAAVKGKRTYNALNASSVGLEMGISVGLGALIGYYLDKWLGTQPWMMLLWLLFGLVAGFRGVFRAVARAEAAAQEDDQIEEAKHGRP
jgi:ATP synthase protein I